MKNTSKELDKRNLDLSTLFEISQVFNSSLELKEILNLSLLIPMGRMMVSRGLVLLNDGRGHLNIAHSKGIKHLPQQAAITIDHLPNHTLSGAQASVDEQLRQFMESYQLEIIVPLASRNELCGALFLGGKTNGTDFSPSEIEFLSALVNLSAQALENARTIRELRKVNQVLDQKVQQLNSLFDIGQELSLLMEQDAILNRLSYTLMGQLMVNQFFVALKQKDGLNVAYSKGKPFTPENLTRCMDYCSRLPEDFTPQAIEESTMYKTLHSAGIRAVIPMRVQSKIKGYLFLGKRLNHLPYAPTDLEYLAILANMTAISLDNAAMITEMIEKKRLEEEIAIARSIQARLIPSQMPELPQYDIHGLNRPSRDVGGDYFDIIPLSSEEYLFTIADVSGKGVPAALLMSNLQAALHSLCLNRIPLSTLTAQLNKIIYQNTSMEKFITFFIMTLDLNSGAFEYVNAGHNPPYVFRSNGEVIELEEGGLILGIFPDATYQSGSGILHPGDVLTMFTDGITEAMNAQEEEYQEKRVINFFRRHSGNMTSHELNKKLLAEVMEFSETEAVQSDDITLLTIRRLK